MKQTVKRITPEPLWDAARSTYDALARLPELPAAAWHPWRRASRKRLAALRDIHKGERCFIIGNGPSLRSTDLHRLRNEFTFGLNRIYLLFPELGFTTTYFLSMNDLVIEQCAAEIQALPIPKFLTWRSHRFIDFTEDTHFLYTTYTGPKFARDVTGRLWEGATVTYVALQLAYHMGFEKVILIGVDHNFVTKGDANKTITSQGDDPNHFAPNYFGKGFKWQLPDLETSERAYRMAKSAYAAAGRAVLDATVAGKLTVFPKVDYNDLFK
ncbi:MAG TPA: 6-hydroxymethylpterin diphosphokinase MptE-like protein [Anaerolineales bacterium]|nr:6-hydroxymethylpterin diphosphokinase MptE-like protein [Anaerolineales bacterium]